MMRFRVLILFVLCIVLVLPVSLVGANEITHKQQELDLVKKQIQDAEKRAADVGRQEQSVLSELARLEREIDRTSSDLRTIESRLKATESELQTLHKELNEAEARLALRNQQLGTRLRALYERGAVSYFEVLLSASSFSEFINRFLVLQTVINGDVGVYHAVQEEKAIIAAHREEVEVKKQQIVALNQQTQTQKAALQSRAASRTVVLTQLSTEKEQTEKALAEMERLAKELDKIIADLQARYAAGAGTGVFIWPTPDSKRITSPFGWRTHPISRVREFHSGIDIGGLPTGRNIVAADSGTVILADWFGGYGKTVIIDHGKGFTTLYAHCHNLLVKEGQQVAKGQIIAHVGTTGMSTGPHLHFEVRLNGNRVSPLDYVPVK